MSADLKSTIEEAFTHVMQKRDAVLNPLQRTLNAQQEAYTKLLQTIDERVKVYREMCIITEGQQLSDQILKTKQESSKVFDQYQPTLEKLQAYEERLETLKQIKHMMLSKTLHVCISDDFLFQDNYKQSEYENENGDDVLQLCNDLFITKSISFVEYAVRTLDGYHYRDPTDGDWVPESDNWSLLIPTCSSNVKYHFDITYIKNKYVDILKIYDMESEGDTKDGLYWTGKTKFSVHLWEFRPSCQENCTSAESEMNCLKRIDAVIDKHQQATNALARETMSVFDVK